MKLKKKVLDGQHTIIFIKSSETKYFNSFKYAYGAVIEEQIYVSSQFCCIPAVLTQVCAESASHHVLLTGSTPASRHNMPRRQMALRLPPHILNSQSRDLMLYSRQPGLTLSKDKDAESALSFMFFVFLLSLGGRDKQLFVGKLAHSPRMCVVTVRRMLCWRNRARCTIQEQEVPKKTQLVITGGFMSDIQSWITEIN